MGFKVKNVPVLESHYSERALPQTAQGNLFKVVGSIFLVNLVGEVTEAIQSQSNDAKIVADPSTGSDTDLCAVLDITGDTVGTKYVITGTPTDAMVAYPNGAGEGQATTVLISEGYIALSCSASTGFPSSRPPWRRSSQDSRRESRAGRTAQTRFARVSLASVGIALALGTSRDHANPHWAAA